MPVNNNFHKNTKQDNSKMIWEKSHFNKNIEIIENINNENINSLNKSPKSPTSRSTCRDWKEEVNRDNSFDGSSPLAIPIPVFCY